MPKLATWLLHSVVITGAHSLLGTDITSTRNRAVVRDSHANSGKWCTHTITVFYISVICRSWKWHSLNAYAVVFVYWKYKMSDHLFRMSSSFLQSSLFCNKTGNIILSMCWYSELLPVILFSLGLTFIEVTPWK